MILKCFYKGQRARAIPDDALHDIRNALTGIQYERKRMFKALKAMLTALLGQEKHMKRIEEALNGRTDSENKTP